MMVSLYALAFLTQGFVAAPPPQAAAQNKQDKTNPFRRYQLKDLDKAAVTIDGKHKLTLWVMDTEAKRQEGMMFLEESDYTEQQGMVFVFKDAEPLSFWMKNTKVPLDIAYLGQDKKVIQTYTMSAFDTTSDYSSHGSAMYAIEVKSGLWKKLGVKVGSKFEIPATVKAKD